MIKKIIAILLISILTPACAAKQRGVPGQAADLNQIKGLSGVWESTPDQGQEKEKVVYKISSGGSIVQEILFPGTPHEMVSIYQMDGNQLMMTHYCMLGNQPQLRATRLSDNSLLFRFAGGTNIRSRNEPHMDELKMTFLGPDELLQEWRGYKEDGAAETKVIKLKRQR